MHTGIVQRVTPVRDLSWLLMTGVGRAYALFSIRSSYALYLATTIDPRIIPLFQSGTKSYDLSRRDETKSEKKEEEEGDFKFFDFRLL